MDLRGRAGTVSQKKKRGRAGTVLNGSEVGTLSIATLLGVNLGETRCKMAPKKDIL
jgi:hypothetical protein